MPNAVDWLSQPTACGCPAESHVYVDADRRQVASAEACDMHAGISEGLLHCCKNACSCAEALGHAATALFQASWQLPSAAVPLPEELEEQADDSNTLNGPTASATIAT
jgi:hypothetical protein